MVGWTVLQVVPIRFLTMLFPWHSEHGLVACLALVSGLAFVALTRAGDMAEMKAAHHQVSIQSMSDLCDQGFTNCTKIVSRNQAPLFDFRLPI